MGQLRNLVFPRALLTSHGMEGYVHPPVVQVTSGVDPKTEERNQTASEGYYELIWPAQNRLESERRQIYEFYMSVGGMRDSFLVLDPRPYFSAVTGAVLGIGDGVQIAFQALHPFGDYAHTVTKLVPGTGKLYIDGVAYTAGFDWPDLTGLVTFVDVQRAVTGATKGATTTLTVGSGHGLAAGGSVYLTDFTDDWTALNDARYRILSTTSNTITIDYDSSGFPAYADDGGQVDTVPQAGEVVSADFQHYYPCRFASEMRGPDLIINRVAQVAAIRLVEVRD